MRFYLRLAAIHLSVVITGTGIFASDTERGKRVRFEQTEIVIPTYTFGKSSTHAPLFQAANTKGLYPYAPLDRDSLSEKPKQVRYEALFIENEYLRVQFLPELGGRVWSVWDKINGRHVFHYDNVIKPSAYNFRGGWPAGNLELYGPFDTHMLTWPGEPWSWALKRAEDGSATVILSHIDHVFRNKIFLETTLRRGVPYRTGRRDTAPHYLAAHRNLGRALLESGKTLDAVAHLTQAASIRPDDMEIISGLSRMYLRLSRPEEASKVVETARHLQPDNDRLLQMTAAALANVGRYDDELEILVSHAFGPLLSKSGSVDSRRD